MSENNYVLVYKANNESEIYNDNSYSNRIPKNYRIKFSKTKTKGILLFERYLHDNNESI